VLLAVGCTGGKHRSVAIAEEIAARLSRRPASR
jgi:RNase adaptor protein for sRNA GlmZ degradation